jgi:hypothetical protein
LSGPFFYNLVVVGAVFVVVLGVLGRGILLYPTLKHALGLAETLAEVLGVTFKVRIVTK